MKLLWQQVLGVMAVIIVALGVSAGLISRSMSQYIFKQKQDELVAYGVNIVTNQFTRYDLARTSKLLAQKDIVIQVYLADGTVIYPSYDQRNKLQLEAAQLERITRGEMIGIQRSERYNRDGHLVEMATVYISNEGGYSEFPAGFISIGAPLSDLDTQINEAEKQIWLSFAIAAIIGVMMTLYYSYSQTKRIKRLQQATKQIASGQYDLELNVLANDELGDLARDFTSMASALRKSEDEIQRQETIRRQMMMDAAHEMRTPLTTMSGVLEGLYYDMIPEGQKQRSIELVMTETQRLTRLVNENLDYEKIRNGQIVLKKQDLRVQDVFMQIAQQLETKATAKGNRIKLEVEPQVLVWADYDRFVQIVLNIATNAIQFSSDSDIILRSFMTASHTVVHVQDFGMGISKEQIENIWERFYKADISRKNTQFGESGIGLSVVKSLVEAHKGSIDVESQENVGTTFIIQFPIKNQEEAA